MPDRVKEDQAYQNAKIYSDRQNAWIEHNAALKKQITASLKDNTETTTPRTKPSRQLN